MTKTVQKWGPLSRLLKCWHFLNPVASSQWNGFAFNQTRKNKNWGNSRLSLGRTFLTHRQLVFTPSISVCSVSRFAKKINKTILKTKTRANSSKANKASQLTLPVYLVSESRLFVPSVEESCGCRGSPTKRFANICHCLRVHISISQRHNMKHSFNYNSQLKKKTWQLQRPRYVHPSDLIWPEEQTTDAQVMHREKWRLTRKNYSHNVSNNLRKLSCLFFSKCCVIFKKY